LVSPVKTKSSAISIIESVFSPKLKLDNVTLVCVDDRRPDLAKVALDECQKRVAFGAVKLLTSATGFKNSVAIKPVKTIEQYCRFIIKELHGHIDTSHALIVQWDGYVINADGWHKSFLGYDYIGSPWKQDGQVGNGGFSLRSKKLLAALAVEEFSGPFTPEDCYICRTHKDKLQNQFGIQFAPRSIAEYFSIEDAAHHGQFGFHSFLTSLPKGIRRPLIFHHSGDLGDIIYALPTIKALGGGVLYISRAAHPQMPTRVTPSFEGVENIRGLIEHQDYIWRCQYTDDLPQSLDYDFNRFRSYYAANDRLPHESLFHMQSRCCEIKCDESQPWLSVDYMTEVPGKPIIVSRSLRYHNDLFPWQQLVSEHAENMLFVGTMNEYSEFTREFGFVSYFETPHLLALARVIAGARVCIMNQSAPCAIALGMGANVIQESWSQDANCRLRRKNAVYCTDDKLTVPKGWL
jgi:hypothetical protein